MAEQNAPREDPRAASVPLPALLRASRGAYGHAIRRELDKAGFSDVPRSAPFILGGMVNQGVPIGKLVPQLGRSKQAASQLVDTLVERGYLERSTDADDRRVVTVIATERGRQAAAAVRAGVASVDKELAGMLSPEELAGLRNGLVALCDIRDRYEDELRAGA